MTLKDSFNSDPFQPAGPDSGLNAFNVVAINQPPMALPANDRYPAMKGLADLDGTRASSFGNASLSATLLKGLDLQITAAPQPNAAPAFKPNQNNFN